MGLPARIFYTGVWGSVGVMGYLAVSTTLTSPLPRDDRLWSSAVFQKYNPHRNPSTQDIVTKRISLEKIKPELLQKEGDLTVAFCRSVWSGLGYRIQRSYLSRKYNNSPETSSQLWTNSQLATSDYERGTIVTDHFEVVDKTATEITVRCGDTPRNPGLRESDGLFIISAEIDEERREAVLGLKSCFYNSAQKQDGIAGPMPVWIEKLHTWYSRILLETASWSVKK